MLLFSRRQLMQAQDIDLNEVMANMTTMLRPLIGEHISIDLRPSPGGAPVRADPGMIEQAVMNLADTVFVLNEGRLIAQGPPTQIANDARVIEAYLGHRAAEAARA